MTNTGPLTLKYRQAETFLGKLLFGLTRWFITDHPPHHPAYNVETNRIAIQCGQNSNDRAYQMGYDHWHMLVFNHHGTHVATITIGDKPDFDRLHQGAVVGYDNFMGQTTIQIDTDLPVSIDRNRACFTHEDELRQEYAYDQVFVNIDHGEPMKI